MTHNLTYLLLTYLLGLLIAAHSWRAHLREIHALGLDRHDVAQLHRQLRTSLIEDEGYALNPFDRFLFAYRERVATGPRWWYASHTLLSLLLWPTTFLTPLFALLFSLLWWGLETLYLLLRRVLHHQA